MRPCVAEAVGLSPRVRGNRHNILGGVGGDSVYPRVCGGTGL